MEPLGRGGEVGGAGGAGEEFISPSSLTLRQDKATPVKQPGGETDAQNYQTTKNQKTKQDSTLIVDVLVCHFFKNAVLVAAIIGDTDNIYSWV